MISEGLFVPAITNYLRSNTQHQYHSVLLGADIKRHNCTERIIWRTTPNSDEWGGGCIAAQKMGALCVDNSSRSVTHDSRNG
jgi:hypothetical protein